MAKMTINEVMQKAVTAYNAGETEAAKRLFARIIEIEPNQPDANHNMGLLLVKSGNVEDAASFFKTALEANFSAAQYWFSYIDALFKLGRYTESSELLAIAKTKGCEGKAFNDLDKSLGLVQIKLEIHIERLLKLIDQGDLAKVLEISEKLLKETPDSLGLLNVISLANEKSGNFGTAVEYYKQVLKIIPDYSEAYYNMGNALQEQGKLEEAIEAYNKALSLKPDCSESYYNMGIALKKQGKLAAAIEAYNKSLSLKSDNAEAYRSMGIALKEQGKLTEAIEAYNKALAHKPDYAEAHNSMGNALTNQGKPEEAIEAFNKALAIKPDFAEAIENSQSLAIQLLTSISKFGYEFYKTDTQANSKIMLRPKYQIQNAIKAFLEADFRESKLHNNNFKACDQNLLDKLQLHDKVFCSAYSCFLDKLLENNCKKIVGSETEKKVYHLGESHCLSYAHQSITIDGSNFRIAPRITFGAKAFHLSRRKDDSFKAITKTNFASLPKCSKVFLSFGEIDCRPNEGFITAARKLDKPLVNLIADTVRGYVQWFLEQNEGQNHCLYFINVPAPHYEEKHSPDLNYEVARAVALFNAALKKYTLQHSCDLVDVFKFTVGKEGFSNGLFHVDSAHLGAKAIPELEQQLI